MAGWFRYYNLPTVTVATKADKLSKNLLARQLIRIRKELELKETDPLFPFSAITGAGRDLLFWSLPGKPFSC